MVQYKLNEVMVRPYACWGIDMAEDEHIDLLVSKDHCERLRKKHQAKEAKRYIYRRGRDPL